MNKRLGSSFLVIAMVLVAACSDDVPLGGNDDAGASCTTASECAVIETCMLCADGSSACPTAECVSGECVAQFPACPGPQCASSSDCPQMGAACELCPDGSASCPTVECVNGQCAGSWPGCSGFNPCESNRCGESCTICDPADPDCVAPAVMMYCDEYGSCGMEFPSCGAAQCGSNGDCPAIEMCQVCPDGTNSCATSVCENGQCEVTWPACGGYEPCAGKVCGEECSVCDPTGPDCVAPAVVTYCDSNGDCAMSFPSCGGAECSSNEDCPQVGAPCTVCPDGSESCPSSECVAGHCTVSWPGCAGYDPCDGKACGENCTLCDPTDPDCVEAATLTFCDALGACGMAYPACP